MIKFNGINHLAFATNDMEATVRFWRDLLGMRLIGGIGKAQYRQYFFELSDKDMIAFFEWPNVEKIPVKDHGVPVIGSFAFDHVSFSVDSDGALWFLKEKLEAAGFWVSEMIDHGFIHSIYSFDPNHIPIEFSAAVEDVDLRKHPRMLDKNPSRAAREGPQPQPGLWPEPINKTPESDKFIFPGEGVAFSEVLDEDSK